MKRYPLEEMRANNKLISAIGALCLEKPGELYLIYIPAGNKNPMINLPENKKYDVKWFNPRTGGELIDGSVSVIKGKGSKFLGNPPGEINKDWVLVVSLSSLP
jgi:hypothetical protein